MGREVRMVPADWVHPIYNHDHPYVRDEGKTYLVGCHISLFKESHEEALAEWIEGKKQWDNGFEPTYSSTGEAYQPKSEFCETYSWKRYAGPKPKPENHMPSWSDEEKTHYMMYENTSEGTPISPAFATPHELAYWLANTGASSFGDFTATYQEWLHMIVGYGYAVGLVLDGSGMRSSVEADYEFDKAKEIE